MEKVDHVVCSLCVLSAVAAAATLSVYVTLLFRPHQPTMQPPHSRKYINIK